MQKSVHVGDLEETENTETERVEVANCSRVVFPWQNLNSKQKNLGLSQKRISTPLPPSKNVQNYFILSVQN